MESDKNTTGHLGKKSSRPSGGSGSATASVEPSESNFPDSTSTKCRVFGVPEDKIANPRKKHSNPAAVFESCQKPADVSVTKKKKYVPRNPITGEGLEASLKESPEKENEEKSEEDKEDPKLPGQATNIGDYKPPGGPASGTF